MIDDSCRGSRWLPIFGLRSGRWQCPLQVIAAVAFLAACNRAPDTRTHVLIWHQKIGGERDLFNDQVARFNATHRDVVIDTLYKENEELRNLFVIAAVAGQGPDII